MVDQPTKPGRGGARPNSGGARPGAGRPAIEDGTEVRVTLPPDLLAEAERLAGRAGKGAAAAGIRALLQASLNLDHEVGALHLMMLAMINTHPDHARLKLELDSVVANFQVGNAAAGSRPLPDGPREALQRYRGQLEELLRKAPPVP